MGLKILLCAPGTKHLRFSASISLTNGYATKLVETINEAIVNGSVGTKGSRQRIILNITLHSLESVLEKEKWDEFDEGIRSLLQTLRKRSPSHVLRLTLTKSIIEMESWLKESLIKCSKDENCYSFMGEKMRNDLLGYESKTYLIRLTMVSKLFKGYSYALEKDAWAMDCEHCQMDMEGWDTIL